MGMPQQPTGSGVVCDEIAVIGMGCRFPGGASDPEKFWNLLYTKRSAFCEVPESRYNVNGFHHASRDKLNTLSARGGHFLREDVAAFDAPFFKITAQEATAMDPTARMLLEVTYEALENAGLPIENLVGSDTSCYVGCFTRDYHEMLMRDAEMAPMYAGTGTGFSLLSNRLSWFYDFRGPSMTLDTACSSSLVGLHLACQGLRSGESSVAVVCGANLILSPDLGMWLSNLHMTSTDGLSRSFADGVTGYGRGEGIATVILKPLKNALRDGDSIRAVIRGTGVNQDGHTTGITLPNRDAQADLIRSTYLAAGLDFSETSYFEAHGTGTEVGDPLELGAVAQTVSKVRTSSDPLYVGSVKSNIGHLEGAAGLAGVIKCVLMLEKGEIVPNIHFDIPNQRIPFDAWKIAVPTEVVPWPEQRLKRASVNSFGYGGTNAHVILDNAEEFLNIHSDRVIPQNGVIDLHDVAKTRLFVFSAPDESALRQVMQQGRDHLMAVEEELSPAVDYLDRLAFTLSNRRSQFQWRAAVNAKGISSLTQALSSPAVLNRSSTTPRIAFVFTGQGAQWARMGMELWSYPIFRASLQEADSYLSTHHGCKWSVIQHLQDDTTRSRINQAQFSQPLCTIIQIALVELLKSWNVEPTAVVGHSSGEIAAAYCYGALTREDAWAISYHRGKVCAELNENPAHEKGAMMAVGASEDVARGYVDRVQAGKVVIACINSPSSVTVSGDAVAIDELHEILVAANVFCRKLKVENAYHSHHMEKVAAAYLKTISYIQSKKPGPGNGVKMVSSVTGDVISHDHLGPEYWVQNFVSPVLFSGAVSIMLKDPGRRRRRARDGESAVDILVEVGPHSALKGPLRQILQYQGLPAVTYASLLYRGEDATVSAIQAAGDLFTRGVPVSVSAVNSVAINPRPLVDLPIYPWNHALKYWAESRLSRNYRFRSSGRHDLLGAPVPDFNEKAPRWRNILRIRDQPWIRDHIVHSSILYPGSGSIVMVLEAVQQLARGDSERMIESIRLEHVRITKAIVLPSDQSSVEMVLQLRWEDRVNNTDSQSWAFSILSCLEGSNLEKNCSGHVTVRYLPEETEMVSLVSGKDLMWRAAREKFDEGSKLCKNRISPEAFYAATKAAGLQYGPLFQGLEDIFAGSSRCMTTIRIPDTRRSMPMDIQSPHLIHPTTLDIIFHSMFCAIGKDGLDLENAAVPIEFDSLIFYMDLPTRADSQLRGFCHTRREGPRDFVADIYVTDMDLQTPQILVQGIRCRELPPTDGGVARNPTTAPVGTLVWKPDLHHIDETNLKNYITSSLSSTTPSQSLMNGSNGGDLDDIAIIPTWDQEIACVVDLAAHKNPDLRILQVGICEGLTRSLIEVLGGDPKSTMRFSNYTITDTDSSIVNESAEALAEFSEYITFNVIDPQITEKKDELWAENLFDLILLVAGLNTVPALQDIAKCLCPGGSIIHANSPYKPESGSSTNVDQIFNSSQLSCFPDCSLTKSWYLARNRNSNHFGASTDGQSTVILVPAESDGHVLDVAYGLSSEMERGGSPTQIVHWAGDMSSILGRSIISLLEFDSSFLCDITAEQYAGLKALMLGSSRWLWVAMGSDPVMQLAVGYLRVLQNENVNLDLIYILLEDQNARPAQEIANILASIAVTATTDREYIEMNGMLNINRMIPDSRLTQIMQSNDAIDDPDHIPLGEANFPLKLVCVNAPAQKSLLCVPIDHGIIGANEVEVEVHAMGVCGYELDEASSKEFSGIITKTGESCTRLKPGDRIWGCTTTNSLQTSLRMHESLCQPIPETVAFDESACWGLTLATARESLISIAQLQRGQTVLIQEAASPTGQYAIQIAQRQEASIFVTVSSQQQRTILQKMGIAQDNILYDNDPDLAAAISYLTHGEGFNVILNQSLTGQALRDLWASVASSGTLVDTNLNTVSEDPQSHLPRGPFTRGATYSLFNASQMLRERPSHMAKVLEDISRHELQRWLRRPSPWETFPTRQALEALEWARKHSIHGKAILAFPPTEKIPVPPTLTSPLTLDSQATYLIAGGMKGLGGNLATLLAQNGARHLAIISRSGLSSGNAVSFVHSLEALGANTKVFTADISDETAMEKVLTQCWEEMPPIRGVIQSAAVLNDSIYENMSHDQWVNAVRPKVQGSWVLHRLLPKQLDFFIMLSSIAGVVGNRSQANYAAGNTYQDALAAYRRRQGLPAVSVDLGLMIGIGLIAERGGATNLKKWEAVGVHEGQFHRLMKAAMMGTFGSLKLPTQVVCGLPTGGILQAEGLERPFYFDSPRFSYLRKKDVDMTAYGHEADDENSPASQLAQAQSMQAATDIVTRILSDRLARELQTAAENIDANRPLHAYGVDSLMAVELRTWVSVHLQAEISLFEVLSAGSIAILSGKIAAVSKIVLQGIRQ